MPTDLLQSTPRGLYCAAGDFYIDLWRRVDRAIITHAHSDHARPGHARYLAHRAAEGVLRIRLGEIDLQCVEYGEVVHINGVRIALYPAGHVLGSAQVRIEHRGEVWVVSGDYKVEPDPTCAPFEAVRCDAFVTESTFGLPVYRWPAQRSVFADLDAWWRDNAAAGRASVVYAYSFGKANPGAESKLNLTGTEVFDVVEKTQRNSGQDDRGGLFLRGLEVNRVGQA